MRLSACQTVTTKHPTRAATKGQHDPSGSHSAESIRLLSLRGTPSIVIRTTGLHVRWVSRANE